MSRADISIQLRAWQAAKRHLRVFGIAVIFGLGIYTFVIVFALLVQVVKSQL